MLIAIVQEFMPDICIALLQIIAVYVVLRIYSLAILVLYEFYLVLEQPFNIDVYLALE